MADTDENQDQAALANALKATATHWPEQPNPAAPYLAAFDAYRRGGVPAVLEHFNVDYPGRGRAEASVRLRMPDDE